MSKVNCVVVQSGGPTVVINSSLLGVIKACKKNSDKVETIYGSLYGITGLLKDNLMDLNTLSDKELEALKSRPGAYLGSARYCLSKESDYLTIIETLNKHNIKNIIFIGGNDSMDSTAKLSKYFKKHNIDVNVIGVPKTIDNDLVVTDHSPGYGSAINFISSIVKDIKIDTLCYEKGRVTIVEIMGRDAGWLTAGSKLASLSGYGPDLIYLPEVVFDMDKFLADVEALYKKNKKVLVCVSEGIRNKEGVYILKANALSSSNDVFGHLQLGGVAQILATIVQEKLSLPVRFIELNLTQRCATMASSKVDINEAIRCGARGVKAVLNNKTGKMVYMKRVNGKIRYLLTDVSKVANQIKTIPLNWIINDNDISDEFITYAKPLI